MFAGHSVTSAIQGMEVRRHKRWLGRVTKLIEKGNDEQYLEVRASSIFLGHGTCWFLPQHLFVYDEELRVLEISISDEELEEFRSKDHETLLEEFYRMPSFWGVG